MRITNPHHNSNDNEYRGIGTANKDTNIDSQSESLNLKRQTTNCSRVHLYLYLDPRWRRVQTQRLLQVPKTVLLCLLMSSVRLPNSVNLPLTHKEITPKHIYDRRSLLDIGKRVQTPTRAGSRVIITTLSPAGADANIVTL